MKYNKCVNIERNTEVTESHKKYRILYFMGYPWRTAFRFPTLRLGEPVIPA
ncbi:Putative protein [Zobellia galactanivorans]|uniref:Uncharacterized protein n=1 Tax=Zobellia galactanivorans (strain DSM 12802 / CCUG 47099 / CIP 106680 / NCIMB 13871 / Dsij) TaxID=63186 RepID=G0L4I6_ZOBGA|nr:Putative protein [Zobellia galactanivorans]